MTRASRSIYVYRHNFRCNYQVRHHPANLSVVYLHLLASAETSEFLFYVIVSEHLCIEEATSCDDRR